MRRKTRKLDVNFKQRNEGNIHPVQTARIINPDAQLTIQYELGSWGANIYTFLNHNYKFTPHHSSNRNNFILVVCRSGTMTLLRVVK